MATRIKVTRLANPHKRKRRRNAATTSRTRNRRRRVAVKRHRKRSTAVRKSNGQFAKRRNPVRRKRRATAKRRNTVHRARARNTVKRRVRRNPAAPPKRKTRNRRRTATTRRRTHTRRRATRRNPALLVTLGSINPRRRKSSMARRRRHGKRRNPTTKRRNSTRITVLSPRRNSRRRVNTRRRRRNPVLFGQAMRPLETGKTILGGLIGVTAAKLIPPMLPATLTSNAPLRILVTGAVAFGAGMLANKAGGNFGSAVLFGGLMQTASIALNAFIPSIGRQIGLQGLRGMGALVPGQFTLPQNPIMMGQLQAAPAPVAVAKGVSGVFGRGL